MTRSNDYSYNDASGAVVNDRAIINMSGVNARHMGIELELKSTPADWLELTAMLSLGDWQWDSNPIGYYYNSLGQPLADLKDTVADSIGNGNHAWSQLNLKGIKVGGYLHGSGDPHRLPAHAAHGGGGLPGGQHRPRPGGGRGQIGRAHV